jgi:hypothetical protein
MNEVEISGLLDAHDALVAAGVEGTLSFDEFVMAYGGFPGGYGLEEDAAAETRAILPMFRKRIAFHRLVAGVLLGFRSVPESPMPDNAEEFMQKAIILRLRQFVARYPDFKAESPVVRDLLSENVGR